MTLSAERRALVVGGFGYIGARLTAELLTAGAHVTIVTPSRERHGDAAVDAERRGARVVEADVRDLRAMVAAVASQDVIFHLAGQSGAVRSMVDPWTDLDVNCAGALSLLEAMRVENRQARLVFAGSRLEYGHVGSSPVSEDQPFVPLCVHGIHKLTIENYLRLYEQLFGLRFTVARITNPYGPGQPRSRTAYGVVNRLIHLAVSGEVLPIYGDGRQRRDYIYIDDVVGALVALAGSDPSVGRAYNVGTGTGIPIAEMARMITRICGGGRVEFVEWPPEAEQIETGDFVADISRVQREVGWTPVVGLEEGLQRTADFYRAQVVQ